MFSREYRQDICRRGYDAWNKSGPNALPVRFGIYDRKLAWCFETGVEAAKQGASLKDAFHTLELVHG